MTRLAWLAVAWTLACTSRPVPTAATDPTAQREPPPKGGVASEGLTSNPASEPEQSPGSYRKQDLARAACTQRRAAEPTPCRPVEWLSGGKDSAGRELVVVKLALFDGPGVGDDLAKRQAGACDHYEYWLVPVAEARVDQPHLLLGVCNDGYGAAGVGEDLVEVSANTFKHSQSGGSAWRWSQTVAVTLSPLRPRSNETNSFWTLDAHFESWRFDWETLQGRDASYTPYCKPDGSIDQNLGGSDEIMIGGDLESPPDYAFATELVPALTLDPTFLAAPESVDLGSCALTLDSGKTQGFLLEGTPGGPGDALLRVVANHDGTRIFIEVQDDVFTSRPQQLFDRLQLWSSKGGEGDNRSGDNCRGRSSAKISGFEIDMAGRVDRKFGQGESPKVTVTKAANGVRRFALAWRKPLQGVTLGYADSDDGTSLKRRFATSRLRPDNTDSLGYLYTFGVGEATCRVQQGRLEPVVTLPFRPKVP